MVLPLGLVILGAMLVVWGQMSSPRQSAAQQAPPLSDPANEHTIAVMFNYDFKANPSCAEKPKLKSCTEQFVVYDVSGPKVRLFSIPVPDGARGLVQGIKGESPRRTFIPGKHVIAVMAQSADGVESLAVTTTVEVKSKTAESSPPAR